MCALVTTILTGENPLSIYGTILKGAFGTARKSWTTWENVAILLGISLAVTPASRCASGTSAPRGRSWWAASSPPD